MLVIPLRLTGGTLDVYQQLSNNEKADAGLTKAALYKAFVIDNSVLYYRPIHGTTEIQNWRPKCIIFRNFRRKLSQPLLKILRIAFGFTLEDNRMCWKLDKWKYVFLLWTLIIIMLRSHIHEYGHVRNGHRMLITIEHMNLRIQKHSNDFLFR